MTTHDHQPRRSPSRQPARDHPLLPRARRRVAERGDDLHRGDHPLRLCPRRRAAGRGGAARGPGPAGRPDPAQAAEERLGAARRGRPRAGRVGRLLRGRRRQAGGGRGRLDPRGHRARGRRPGPRRRPVPGRDRAVARAGAARPTLPYLVRQRPAERRSADRCDVRPVRAPARRLGLLPALRRLAPARRWSSGPPSRRWTPSPSPTATAPTAR